MKYCLPMAAGVFLLAQPGWSQTATDVITSRAVGRFLDQATWGPTPGSIAQLQTMGITNWLNAQFAMNTSDLPDQPVLNAAGKSNKNLAPVQEAFFQNAVTGSDQLRQRVAFILSQIWVVSATSGVQPAYAYPPYWRIFRDNAFGNYRDVIKAVTLSPAMGRYLNMANNAKANPAKGTAPNENYARELMQLFTLGLTQLNPDGSPMLDSSGNPIPTYDQTVVTNMAKLLTGWTYPTAPGATPKANNPQYFVGQMFAVEGEHDRTSKTLFGNVVVPAGQTAEQDLDSLLDALMKQPTMAPFVSQQLIQHLVTSNPSPAYITRISKVFEDNGKGVTADLKAVITAILTDTEARAADDPTVVQSVNFGHLREPILFMTAILRGLNATLGAKSAIYDDASELGEDLFYAPSVFSYFSPQSRTEKGLFGPEFQIYSTQTAVDRANLVNSAVYGTLDKGTQINLGPFTKLAANTTTLLNSISEIFLHGSMTTALQLAATDALNAAPTAEGKAQAALYIVLTSSEYQIVQ